MINTEQTKKLLLELKLQGMAATYESVLRLAGQHQPSAHELVALMADAEEKYRIRKREQMYLKLSKLRYDCILENVHCGPERNFDKDQLLLLCDCSFIKNAQNILICGATGCGKSYLACAIGRQACMLGHRTLYFGMLRFIEKIVQTKLDGTFVKFLDQVNKCNLLILDDFGLSPIDNQAKVALLQILEDRYGNKATVIASQLPIDKWYGYLEEPTLADAIVDRLSASANIINLKGPSLRGEELK